MRDLLSKYTFLRSPDSGAGGGGSAAGGAGGEGGAGGGTPPAPSNGNAGGEGGSGGGEPPAPELYRPSGLPETMFGTTNNETMDKMATTIAGYRERDSNAPKAPKDAGEYLMGDMSDDIKPYFDNLKGDPVYEGMQAAALKNGLMVDQFNGFVTDNMTAWAEAGLLSPIVDVEAERKELIPDHAQFMTPDEQALAIDARMKDNIDWVENVGIQKGLDKEMGEFLIENLGDSAKGHKFLEMFRSLADKSFNPLAGGGGGEGGDIKAQLAAREGDPRNNPRSPQYLESFAIETSNLFNKAYPNE